MAFDAADGDAVGRGRGRTQPARIESDPFGRLKPATGPAASAVSVKSVIAADTQKPLAAIADGRDGQRRVETEVCAQGLLSPGVFARGRPPTAPSRAGVLCKARGAVRARRL